MQDRHLTGLSNSNIASSSHRFFGEETKMSVREQYGHFRTAILIIVFTGVLDAKRGLGRTKLARLAIRQECRRHEEVLAFTRMQALLALVLCQPPFLETRFASFSISQKWDVRYRPGVTPPIPCCTSQGRHECEKLGSGAQGARSARMKAMLQKKTQR